MKIVIVTGLSGAGKTETIKTFEDMNYFCIDNMLPDLIPNFLEYFLQMKSDIENVALGIDIRGGNSFEHLISIINKTQSNKISYEILFLDCSDEELLRRYKENRRQHPLSVQGRVTDGIVLEREKLKELKDRANYTIDTSDTSSKKLKERVYNIFKKEGLNNLYINIVSFGFKYGIPKDADYVFDVRFLPNPFYINELKTKTGKDKDVYDYVMNSEGAESFVNNISKIFLDIIPHFEQEGRKQIVIAIGCTGGQHRSVSIARRLAQTLEDSTYNVILEHREIE